MGPPKAADVLRDSLFRGADRAILLTDRRAAASDTLATSYILAQAVRTIGRYDFVFCGRQAIDGDTAQVGPQCAEKLGIPQITYLEKLVSVHDRVVRIRRNIGHGWEIVEAKLPVLVTVVESANRAASAGGEAGDADEAGESARRSGRRSEGRHARRLRGATGRRDAAPHRVAEGRAAC